MENLPENRESVFDERRGVARGVDAIFPDGEHGNFRFLRKLLKILKGNHENLTSAAQKSMLFLFIVNKNFRFVGISFRKSLTSEDGVDVIFIYSK